MVWLGMAAADAEAEEVRGGAQGELLRAGGAVHLPLQGPRPQPQPEGLDQVPAMAARQD